MADHCLVAQSSTCTSLKKRLFLAPPRINSCFDSFLRMSVASTKTKTYVIKACSVAGARRRCELSLGIECGPFL
jgi:hypothetical protein